MRFFRYITLPFRYSSSTFLLFFIFLMPNAIVSWRLDYPNLYRFIHIFGHHGIDNTTAFLFAFFLTYVGCILPSKINLLYKYIVYFVLLISSSIRVFLWLSFKMWINCSAFELIQQTNSSETKEFITTYLFSTDGLITFLFLISSIIFVYFFEKCTNSLTSLLKQIVNKHIVEFVTIVLLCLGLYNLSFFIKIYRTNNITNYANILDESGYYGIARGHNTFMDLLVAFKSIQISRLEKEHVSEIAKKIEYEETPTVTYEDTLKIIYILGESHILSHSQLYGYSLETEPNLYKWKESGNLFCFENIYSYDNLTYKVEQNSFFTNTLNEGELWYETPSFMQIFKKAGYFVGFYDNQNNTIYSNIDKINGKKLYDNYLAQKSYSQIARKNFPFDMDFVKNVFNDGIPNSKHSLWVFHLMGQHGPQKERYPNNKIYNHFKASDIKRNDIYLDEEKKKIIATYDNATRYNNLVISEIIDNVKDENAILVYMSDHGEEVYDYRNEYGRVKMDSGLEKQYVEAQFHVPFFIWCSDRYKLKNKDIVKIIMSKQKRYFSTDNISQVLFYIAGIETKYYKTRYNLLDPNYKDIPISLDIPSNRAIEINK